MTDASGSRTQAQEDERQHSRNMPSQVQSKVTAGVQAGKQRIEGTPAKDLLSQLKDADLINEAMMFAALVLMVFFPFLITVAALGPLNQNGAADILVRKMGLSGEAATAVEALFRPNGGTSVTGWTVMGVVWLVVGGVTLAASVQVIYQRAWALPSVGWHGFGAQLMWLALFVVFGGLQMGLGDVMTGSAVGQVCYGVLVFAGLVLFIWVSGRLLTLGRVPWRQLRPTALFTAIGLTGLGVFSKLLFSPSIVSNNEEYGPIGVVFIILSWLIGIAVVITGGAIVGAWYVGADLSFVRGVRRLLGRRDRQPGAGTDQAPE